MSEKLKTPEAPMSLVEAMTLICWGPLADPAAEARRDAACTRIANRLRELSKRVHLSRHADASHRDDCAQVAFRRVVDRGPREEGTYENDGHVDGDLSWTLKSVSSRLLDKQGLTGSGAPGATEEDDIQPPLGGGGGDDGDAEAGIAEAARLLRDWLLPGMKAEPTRSDKWKHLEGHVAMLIEQQADAGAFERAFEELVLEMPRRPQESDAEYRRRVRGCLHRRTNRTIKYMLEWLNTRLHQRRQRDGITPSQAHWLRLSIKDLRPFDRRPPSKPRRARDKEAT